MKITITSEEAWQRFDRFLRKYLKNYDITLSQIFQLIRKWKTKVNNQKKPNNYKINIWDQIYIHPEIKKLNQTKQEKVKNINQTYIKQLIIYEDINWIFFNKPAKTPTQSWTKQENKITMIDILRRYTTSKSKTFSPMFWFRLDIDTTGIIVAAKNYNALKYLNHIIKQRQTDKKYIAILSWHLDEKITVKKNLYRKYDKKVWKDLSFPDDNWDYAKSIFEPIQNQQIYWENITLAKVKIITWRMHQIRAHAKYIWTPIIWDLLYWEQATNNLFLKKLGINRQLLHCYKYSFYDKFQGKQISIKSNYPKDFEKLFKTYEE